MILSQISSHATHTVATILAEMGMDERTIADVLGQKTIEMARHYSRRTDKSRKMESVVKNFEQEVSRRKEKIVKLLWKVSNFAINDSQ